MNTLYLLVITSFLPGSTPLIINGLSTSSSVFDTLEPFQSHRKAVYFDDNNGHLIGGSASSLGLPTSNSSFTIAGWIKPEVSNNTGTITSWGSNNSDNWFRLNGTTLEHRLGSSWTGVEVGDLSDGWHHVAIVYESNVERRFYLDGTLVGSATGSNFSVNNSGVFAIGRRNSSNDSPFWGQLDQVRISNLALYQNNFTPVLNLYTEGNTVQLWLFDGSYSSVQGASLSTSGTVNLVSGGVYDHYLF